MNADFERDPGTYPIGPQYLGLGWKLVHVPTQTVLLDTYLPRDVAFAVCPLLNAEFKGTLPTELSVANATVGAATELHAAGAMNGNTLTHIKQKLSA